MYILVINSGSSSLKFQLLEMKDKKLLAKGVCERIGIDGQYSFKTDKINIKDQQINIPSHEHAIQIVINNLTCDENGVISDIHEINAVGHRAVHGGEAFDNSAIINDDVLAEMRGLIKLAPLHNPPVIKGIEACSKIIPEVPQIAVFDTSFHSTIPDYAYIYPLPYSYYEKNKIRRYGFHGTSHNYVSREAAKFVNRDIKQLKIVSCHMGNGTSITAIKSGKSVDTTMGFTPLEGPMMGTRSGTIDPAIVTYLMEEENMTAQQINDLLNKKSGFIGVSGISNDWRDICVAAKKGDCRAKLAQNIVTTQIKKYIGSYAAVMGGIDILILTAGIGENSDDMRRLVTTDMEFLGIKINSELNENMPRGINIDLSDTNAKVKTLVIPTNEELMIAEETMKKIV